MLVGRIGALGKEADRNERERHHDLDGETPGSGSPLTIASRLGRCRGSGWNSGKRARKNGPPDADHRGQPGESERQQQERRPGGGGMGPDGRESDRFGCRDGGDERPRAGKGGW